MNFIEAKRILQPAPKGAMEWFGMDYNMNLYRGCCHGCIYCDSRSDCYGIEQFSTVRAKKNCIELLAAELPRKRKKGVVAIGAMSDPYNPLERKYELSRQALKLLDQGAFGISIDTKSDLVCRDIDLFQSIAQRQAQIIKLSITCADDALSKKIEPHVCPSSARFAAIEKLSSAGLFSGVLITPLLPFITDNENNLRRLLYQARESGARFAFCLFGMTLRDSQRDYYYQRLDAHFPGKKALYQRAFASRYACKSLQKKALQTFYAQECKSLGLLYRMSDIISAYKGAPCEQLHFF